LVKKKKRVVYYRAAEEGTRNSVRKCSERMLLQPGKRVSKKGRSYGQPCILAGKKKECPNKLYFSK